MNSKFLERRQALRTVAATIVAPAVVACGGGGGSTPSFAQGVPASVTDALAAYAKLEPLTSGAQVRVDAPTGTWSASHNASSKLFVGSAVKTFILAQFLRDVETERNGLKLTAPCEVSDLFRSPGSSVIGSLSGTSNYRNMLEAMIAHSDNMATDIALAKAEPARVRALIAQAGLTQTQIPESTRRLFSYLSGAPVGVDLGWEGMLRLANNDGMGLTPRTTVINADESMLSSAADMVSWYQQVLAGKFFQKATSTREFKRVSSMADALWFTVPDDVIAYGKGGSIDWEGFHALCLAGQMRTRDVPVSFCFTLNWSGGTVESSARVPEFGEAVSKVLASVNAAVRGA
jgi:beta-lactamase class A